MKDLFISLAKYNAATNREINLLISNHKAVYDVESKGHFGSAKKILQHIMVLDISWLKIIHSSLALDNSIINELPVLLQETNSLEPGLIDNIDNYISTRTKVDRIIEKMIEVIPEEKYNKKVKMNILYTIKENDLWRVFRHVFDHQTHHRAQISTVLNQFDIKNDFSNFTRKNF
jgi:uncharacterized damage-inducible protein DinB